MKIKSSSDDDLPFNKSLKFSLMTVTIRCVFKEDNELYPQVLMILCMNYKNDRIWKNWYFRKNWCW